MVTCLPPLKAFFIISTVPERRARRTSVPTVIHSVQKTVFIFNDHSNFIAVYWSRNVVAVCLSVHRAVIVTSLWYHCAVILLPSSCPSQNGATYVGHNLKEQSLSMLRLLSWWNRIVSYTVLRDTIRTFHPNLHLTSPLPSLPSHSLPRSFLSPSPLHRVVQHVIGSRRRNAYYQYHCFSRTGWTLGGPASSLCPTRNHAHDVDRLVGALTSVYRQRSSATLSR